MSRRKEWESTLQKRPMSFQFWFNSIFLSGACNVDWSNAVVWYFSERLRFFGIGMAAFFEEEGVRSSMCKYVRQNTVITARLIPLVRTLQMKINPLGLEEPVKGCEYKKNWEKNRPESWLFFYITNYIKSSPGIAFTTCRTLWWHQSHLSFRHSHQQRQRHHQQQECELIPTRPWGDRTHLRQKSFRSNWPFLDVIICSVDSYDVCRVKIGKVNIR